MYNFNNSNSYNTFYLCKLSLSRIQSQTYVSLNYYNSSWNQHNVLYYNNTLPKLSSLLTNVHINKTSSYLHWCNRDALLIVFWNTIPQFNHFQNNNTTIMFAKMTTANILILMTHINERYIYLNLIHCW